MPVQCIRIFIIVNKSLLEHCYKSYVLNEGNVNFPVTNIILVHMNMKLILKL